MNGKVGDGIATNKSELICSVFPLFRLKYPQTRGNKRYIISSWIFSNWILNIQKIQISNNLSQLRIFADSKTSLQETPIWEESFWRVSRSASFSQKIEFLFVDQVWH